MKTLILIYLVLLLSSIASADSDGVMLSVEVGKTNFKSSGDISVGFQNATNARVGLALRRNYYSEIFGLELSSLSPNSNTYFLDTGYELFPLRLASQSQPTIEPLIGLSVGLGQLYVRDTTSENINIEGASSAMARLSGEIGVSGNLDDHFSLKLGFRAAWAAGIQAISFSTKTMQFQLGVGYLF
jgi:hypothetical protein